MKNILLIPSLIAASLGLSGQDSENNKYILEKVSIVIKGRSNVNEFDCTLENLEGGEALDIIGFYDGESVNFEGLKLNIPIEGFDCGVRMMTRDFRDLLESEKYPKLSLDIKKIILPA